ncbi:hypothetical protein A2707_03410 [Candidatus Saccharibacteria bacterium RIFCSPHIGHO2_01_FULL_45_15]|nr:MAG: hypothetical protein A2707_03410 [Candidatus Saccharibacteria bacterium RIFCSPHIGHO2_01_FULL_45_15]OGL27265.1 MAG: hypothetical protein A3C39_04600 [Candidatus Saccharibacteria bacterium RIFCSPHIGHO2_02_FULL_46_12]OGL32454.1 MAG: hypothetical protein A3E76_00160 [Candidatus Saccharibacteria bacterium RIFCSPHIGHO2_12_FULL_44_22]
MARLPQPGGDKGNWGDILNDYLGQSLKPDGSIKDGVIGSAQLQNNAVTEVLLAGAVQTKLNQPATIADDSIARVKLASSLRTELDTYATPIVQATPLRFPAIDNTGVTATQVGLQAAVDACSPGSSLVLRGTYLLTGTVNIPAVKALTLDLTAATIIRGGSATPLSCVGVFDANVAVSAIALETIVIDGEPATVSRLTTATTPTWQRGDLVKVFSDDEIPGGHFTSMTDRPRLGEFIEVHSVSGTTTYLRGTLRENYVTSPRAARLPYGTVTVLGGTFDVTANVLTNKTRGTAFRFEALHAPKVRGTVAHRLVGPGLQFKSCRGYAVHDYDADFGMNDPTNSVYGYGIHDSSCEDGVITGGTQRGLRHPWTDGTADTAVGDTYPGDFGRTYNTKLIGVTSHGCTASGFDTHHMSKGVQFIGCTAYVPAELNGFLLRGEGHSVLDCTVYGGYSAVAVICQETGSISTGESRLHHVGNIRVEDSNRVLTVNVRANTNHPNYRVTDPELSVVVDGVFARNVTRLAIIVNGNVRLRNVEFVSASFANGAIVQFDNCILRLEDYRIDLSTVTAYDTATQRIWQAGDSNTGFGSQFFAHRGSINTSSAYRTKATTPFYATDKTKRWDVRQLLIETPYASAAAFDLPNQPIECAFEWYHTPQKAQPLSQRRSGSIVSADAALAATPFSQIMNAPDTQLVITANITAATARTLPAFPLGHFDGQRLSIILGSASASLTIPNGPTFNTRTTTGSDKVLSSAGASAHFMWSAQLWREL